jgi:hypothetical protein
MHPLRPIDRIAVKCLVNRALKRAGFESACKGAHILRHSAATTLRHGVSLTGIGTVLRHRQPAMTALINDIERYIVLRRLLGFELEKTARHLRAFARYAMERGDTHIGTMTTMAWAAGVSSTPGGLPIASGNRSAGALPPCGRSTA